MYQNLKRSDHTLKGEVGEIIAKYGLEGAISTKQNTKYILRKFNLKPEQLGFLERNWNSFDLIDPKSLIIYEVKTKNYFYGNLRKKILVLVIRRMAGYRGCSESKTKISASGAQMTEFL